MSAVVPNGPAAAGSSGATTTDDSAGSPANNISKTAAPASIPGLYGNQYELQIDVSRLPRLDEYGALLGASADQQSIGTIPSDVKTVAYYLRSPSAPSGGGSSSLSSASSSGLVRRELDRAVSTYANDNGQAGQLEQSAKQMAPEVTSLEFQYHDGQAWSDSWDSDQRGGMPKAIEIRVGIASPKSRQQQRAANGPAASLAPAADDLVYRLVVRIPVAKPLTGDSSAGAQGTDPQANAAANSTSPGGAAAGTGASGAGAPTGTGAGGAGTGAGGGGTAAAGKGAASP